jgi:hypothetical protein
MLTPGNRHLMGVGTWTKNMRKWGKKMKEERKGVASELEKAEEN